MKKYRTKKNRKKAAVMLVMAILLTIFPTNIAEAIGPTYWNNDVESFEAGIGTEVDPYQIASKKQLAYLAKIVNDGEDTIGKYYIVTADIDLSRRYWIPIGIEGNSFRGTFNGNEKLITGLKIDTQGLDSEDSTLYEGSEKAGLFGHIYGATIENVTVSVNITHTAAETYVGGISGSSKTSTIRNCHVTGDITVNFTGEEDGIRSKKMSVGGLLGNSTNDIIEKSSYSTGTVTGGDGDTLEKIYLGGLVGYSSLSTISDCNTEGSVIGKVDTDAGGLVGKASNTTISNCYTSGTITVGKDGCVGGLVGYSTGTIKDSYRISEIIAEDATFVGGLVGSNSGTIKDCYVTADIRGGQYTGGLVGVNYASILNCNTSGNVSAALDTFVYVGGLIGLNTDESRVSNCHTSGSVTGENGAYIGGLVARNQDLSEITDCYATGAITGGVSSSVGGFVGNNSGATIENSYATGAVIGGSKSKVGGFVAYIAYDAYISNTYARGNVTVGSDGKAGGFIGYMGNDIYIDNSYSTGNITGNSSEDIGGFVGAVSTIYEGRNLNVANSYYNSEGILTADSIVVGMKGEGYPAGAIGYDRDIDIKAMSQTVMQGESASEGALVDILTTAASSNDDWRAWSISPTTNDGYPILKPVTYSIQYMGNDQTVGDVPTDSNEYEQGETVNLLDNLGSLEKSGNVFDGWNTQIDGAGIDYTTGESITMGAEDITLYALWAPVYTIEYNGNENTDGIVPIDPNDYEEGDNIILLSNSGNLEKEGHTYDGWNTQANGEGINYTTGASITMTAFNQTLYAKWKAEEYKVTFKDYDGRIIKSETVDYGKSAIGIEDPIREEYVFIGWDTDFSRVIEELEITATYRINVQATSSSAILMNDGEIYTTTNIVDLEIEAKNAAEMILSENSEFLEADWINYTTSQEMTLSAIDGEKKVYIKFRNGIGNETKAEYDTIILDSTNPSTPTVKTTYDGEYTITITGGSDKGSGIEKIMYKVVDQGDASSWMTYNAPLIISKERTKTIYARTIDKAGNESDQVSTVVKMKNAEENGQENITIKVEEEVTVANNITVSISVEQVKNAASNNVNMIFETNNTLIEVPMAAIETDQMKNNSRLELVCEKLDTTKAENQEMVEAIKNTNEAMGIYVNNIYDFKMKVVEEDEAGNEQEQEVENFTSTEDIRIRIVVGEVDEQVALMTYYYNPTRNEWEYVRGTYENNDMIILTNHLSIYSVMTINKEEKKEELVKLINAVDVEIVEVLSIIEDKDMDFAEITKYDTFNEEEKEETANKIIEKMPDVGYENYELLETEFNEIVNTIYNRINYHSDRKAKDSIISTLPSEEEAREQIIWKDLEGHWAKEVVEILAEKGIIEDDGQGYYRPNQGITRAEFTTIIVKALELEVKETNTGFEDVSESSYDALYIAAAKKAGIIYGVSDTRFEPNKIISRQAMTVMLIRAYKNIEALELDQDVIKAMGKFEDDSEISHWAQEEVYLARYLEVIKGKTIELFCPNDIARKGEAATMIYRVLKSLNRM